MAYDDRYERDRERGRGPGWRGDDSFGGQPSPYGPLGWLASRSP